MGTFAIVLTRHFSILLRASSSETKTCSLRHSSRKPRIEALDVRVLNRLARFDELQLHAVLIGPLVEHPAAQFRTVIRLNHRRQSTPARSRSNTLVTRSPVNERSTSMARLSRLHSSSTAKARKRRPLIRLS